MFLKNINYLYNYVKVLSASAWSLSLNRCLVICTKTTYHLFCIVAVYIHIFCCFSKLSVEMNYWLTERLCSDLKVNDLLILWHWIRSFKSANLKWCPKNYQSMDIMNCIIMILLCKQHERTWGPYLKKAYVQA